ncbi:MAG: DNA primase [Nanoarchaeota archaeon]|nr:DNA primase [Nanoarchaeota archaeon]
MGKISPVSAKYIIHANISIEGVVDRPDVIGAIFGQTEGLLGSELELRELQRSGRIGRIEVDTETKAGKTRGSIIIPSSLDKAETAIVGAALEIIQRIGPCNAKIEVEKIEDVRISKRNFVIERAKELLRRMMDTVMPDSQEIADEVAYSVRVMEIQEYGKSRLASGPAIEESDEIIVVEGRADVLNLLKHGFKNAIAINGTSVPEEIVELGKRKVITAFVDGDRGGILIIQELLGVAEIDYVAKAPDGKEVEEITKKEIHKALRSRVSAEQVKLELMPKEGGEDRPRKQFQRLEKQEPRQDKQQERQEFRQQERQEQKPEPKFEQRETKQQEAPKPEARFEPKQEQKQEKKYIVTDHEKEIFSEMIEDLIGTRGAYILDEKLTILGKVPLSELQTTLKSLSSGVHAVIFDGIIDKDILAAAEKSDVSILIAMDNKVKNKASKVIQLTVDDFA